MGTARHNICSEVFELQTCIKLISILHLKASFSVNISILKLFLFDSCKVIHTFVNPLPLLASSYRMMLNSLFYNLFQSCLLSVRTRKGLRLSPCLISSDLVICFDVWISVLITVVLYLGRKRCPGAGIFCFGWGSPLVLVYIL